MTATDTARRDYRIDEVAARTGFTKRTLRYYEEVGLIVPAGRSEGNYRLYSDDDVTRLQRIKRLKDVLGIPLSDLKRMAEAEETLERLGHALQAKLVGADERRARLHRVRDELRRQLAAIDERLDTLQGLRADYAAQLQRVDEALAR